MASTVYYGISQTAAATQEKRVVLIDSDFNPNNLAEGDILSVYFSQRNEADHPTLALYIGDVEQELNGSSADGKITYNADSNAVLNGAWTDGEVVNFSYTHNGSIVENTDNVYYWEMIGKPKATDETYGEVKIDDLDDDTSAASIGLVKELLGEATVEKLTYNSEYQNSVGTLTLAQYDPEDTSLQNPIEGTVSSVEILIPDIPNDTGDLEFNTAGYITNAINGNLDFLSDSEEPKNDQQIKADGITIINLDEDETHNTIINSNNDIVLNPEGQVIIGSQADNDDLKVYGNIYGNTIDVSGLLTDTIGAHTSEGTITFTSPTNLESTVTMNGGIYIGEQTLENYITSLFDSDANENIITSAAAGLFNDYLKTVRYNAGPYNLSLGDRKQVDFVGNTIHIDGYTPVGVITWETWCHGTSNPENANIFGVWWDNNNPAEEKLHVRVTALDKPAESIMVTVHILYKKNTYAITYDLDGGINGPSTQYKFYNHAIKLSKKEPVKEGYRFVGWKTNGAIPSNHLMPGAIYSYNQNITLVADWI